MSLLDDINRDTELDNVAKLGCIRKAPEVTWTDNGYLAKVITQVCSCGGQQDFVLGVFKESLGSNGTRKLVRVEPFPLPTPESRMEASEEWVRHCYACLFKMGFDNVIQAPVVRTNIAGIGLLGIPHEKD